MVCGEELKDLADGVLDRAAVFREWDLDSGALGSAGG